MPIEHFSCKEVKRLFNNKRTKVPQQLQERALEALFILDAAHTLDDLVNPPGNKLHPLKGDRSHQHAISINGNYRLCFNWNEGNPREVEIIDYH